ncbi:hypothetical protein BGZ73_006302, partial [Actinomortierella ambigua]
MPFLHKEPVVIQRVYFKPSVMDRFISLFAGRHHTHPYPPSRPVGYMLPRKTYARRAPIRRSGLFGRRHRRYVTTSCRRQHLRLTAWMRFKQSLSRPRRAVRGARGVPARPRPAQRQMRPHRHHRRKERIAALLALLTLQNRRRSYPHHRHYHLFRRHHRIAQPIGTYGY